jgi:hypothetical protein
MGIYLDLRFISTKKSPFQLLLPLPVLSNPAAQRNTLVIYLLGRYHPSSPSTYPNWAATLAKTLLESHELYPTRIMSARIAPRSFLGASSLARARSRVNVPTPIWARTVAGFPDQRNKTAIVTGAARGMYECASETRRQLLLTSIQWQGDCHPACTGWI